MLIDEVKNAIIDDDLDFFINLSDEETECLRSMKVTIDESVFDVNTSEDKKVSFEFSILDYAVSMRKLDIVKYLIENDIFSEETIFTDGTYTPLHIACANGYKDIVEYLIGLKNSNVNVKIIADDVKTTPLYLAGSNNHFEIVELLKTHKPDTSNGLDVYLDNFQMLQILNSKTGGAEEINQILKQFAQSQNVALPSSGPKNKKITTSGPTKKIEKNPPKNHLPPRKPR